MSTTKTGEKTAIQKLVDLVEWWIRNEQVEIKFVPNEKRNGRIAPEYDFEYWKDERRVTELALAMFCMNALNALNYNYNLNKVKSAMVTLAWRSYMEHLKYPDFLKISKEVKMRRPRGRPLTKAVEIPYDEKKVGMISMSRPIIEPEVSKGNPISDLINRGQDKL